MPPGPSTPSINNPVADVMAYLMLAVPLHFVLLFVILCVVVLLTKIISPSLTSLAIRWSIWGVAVVFVAGLGGHLYWSEFVWNKVYYSPDYVVDYWMIFPAGEHLMHPAGWPAGHLVGEYSVSDIKLTWLKVATVCWISSILVILMPRIRKLTRSRYLALFGSLLLLQGCGYYPPSVTSSEEVLRLDPCHVSLRVRALPDEAIPALQSRKNLEILFFSHGQAVMESRITDRGLCELSRLSLPRLRVLDLGYCRKISDKGIACLPALTSVRRLALFGCPGVSGEGLRSLRRMDGLVDLDLRGCEVTDADIYNLRSMQNLESIQLGGCRKATSDGVRRLQREMPNTRVEKDDREWSYH